VIDAEAALDALNRWMAARHMRGYWMQEGGGAGAQVTPHLWKWEDVYAGLVKSGAVVPSGEARAAGPRRIKIRHPGAAGVPRAVSVGAAIQMPGELLGPLRGGANVARFVVQAGAIVTAEGETFSADAGDLLVWPAGTEGEWRSPGPNPTIWIECDDAGLLDLVLPGLPVFPLADGQRRSPPKPSGYFAATRDRMSRADSTRWRPPMRYAWSDAFAALTALKASDPRGDPHDGIHLRYTSPVDRGPTLPTFSCAIQLLTPRNATSAHRHNSTAIYHVVRGEGSTEVGGERLDWCEGDVFCVPPWTWHRHANPSQQDAILFSVDDWPAMSTLGFYRVENEEESHELQAIFSESRPPFSRRKSSSRATI